MIAFYGRKELVYNPRLAGYGRAFIEHGVDPFPKGAGVPAYAGSELLEVFG